MNVIIDIATTGRAPRLERYRDISMQRRTTMAFATMAGMVSMARQVLWLRPRGSEPRECAKS